jgi:hypothetical protein
MKHARRRWSSLLAGIGYGAAHLNSVTALALHVEQRDATSARPSRPEVQFLEP